MYRLAKLLPLIVFISSAEILAEHHDLSPTNASLQIHRALTVAETTNPCKSPRRAEFPCMDLFREESSNQLPHPLTLLLTALGLLGLALVTRVK